MITHPFYGQYVNYTVLCPNKKPNKKGWLIKLISKLIKRKRVGSS